MNIGVIIDNEFNGDLRVENEVIALLDAGHQVYILCFNYGDKKDIANFNGANITRISISKNLRNKLKFINNTIFDIYSVWWSYKIQFFARTNKIEVLHTHDLFMARSVILANKKLKLKTVLDLHENYPATLASYSWANSFIGKILVSPKRWQKLESKYLSKFTSVVLLSEQFKNTLTGKYPELTTKFYVYPNFVNIEHLSSFKVDEKLFTKNDDFIIFYFGNIAVRRGIFTLLESLKILVKESKMFKVLLIGPVDNADKELLNSYMNDSTIKNNVIHYDWRDIKFLPSYISISDICVSPLIKNEQHESGIANKIFQYMLFRKPIIVSNCIPQQKVVEDEKCGLVFESENYNDLASKIIALSKNSNQRAQMGANGKKAVVEKYNLNTSKLNLVRMYKDLEN